MSKKNGKHISGNPQKRAALAAEKQRMNGIKTISENIGLILWVRRGDKNIYSVNRNDGYYYSLFIRECEMDVNEEFVSNVRKWAKGTKTPNEGIVILGRNHDGVPSIFIVDNDKNCLSQALKSVCA